MSNNRNDRTPVRRQEAELRDVVRAERTDEEQLQKLILEGHGECKEAKRLRVKLGKS